MADDNASQFEAVIDDLVTKDIIALLGLNQLPEEKQEEIRASMVRTAQNRIAARILEGLDQPTAHTWQKFLAEGRDEEADQLLADNGIDLQPLAVQEIVLLKAEYLAQANVVYGQYQQQAA